MIVSKDGNIKPFDADSFHDIWDLSRFIKEVADSHGVNREDMLEVCIFLKSNPNSQWGVVPLTQPKESITSDNKNVGHYELKETV